MTKGISILARTAGALSVAVFSAAIFPAAAWATEYVVSPTGADSASGLAAAPWRTIQKAFDKVKAGDLVTVDDGTYVGFACDGVSGTATSRITFQSRNRWGAKITSGTGDSSQDFVQLSSCAFVTIDGFEVSGAPRSGIAILGNKNDGSDARGVIVQNCYSHDNGGTSVTGRHDGIFSGFALDLTLQNNRIEKTGEHGIYVSNAADNPSILRNDVSNTGGNCLQINADLTTGGDGLISNWRIEGNILHDCKGAAGINLDGAVRGTAINNVIFNAAKGGFTLFKGDGAEASHDNVIVNNTVYNPKGSRAAIQVAAGADNNIVFNNIFISQSAAFEIQSVSGLMHDYNLVSAYDGGKASAHEVAPSAPAALFADAIGGDLRLVAGASAAVDQGVAIFGGKSAPTTDAPGAARPAGSAYDLGAYELGGVINPGTGGASATGGRGGSTGATGGTNATGGRGGNTGGGATGGTTATGGRGGAAGNATGGKTGTGGRGGNTGNATGGAGGSTGPAGATSGGCGCRAAAGSSTSWSSVMVANLLLLSTAILLLRRRHRSS